METRRRRLRFMSADEEEDRRTSPRKRKRDRYFEGEDYDDDDEDDYDEDEEEEDVEDVEKEEDREDNEQPGPSTQNTHIWRTQEGRLTVICGNKTGILDVEKLRMSEECIMWQGRWFSPPAFEEFGGKGCNKKWKASIFFENKPLQFWIEQGHLATKGYYKRRRAESTKQKKTLSSTHTSESSSEESEILPAEGTDEDDVKDEDWHPCSEELALETEQERAGDENGKGVIDSGDDKNKEEDDKMEKGEMENEDMSVADNDNSVFEEGKWIISTPDKHILRKEVKVIVRRLSEFQTRNACQSSCTEEPPEENWFQPLGEDAQNEEGREHNGSAIDDHSDHSYTSQMSGSPITGAAISTPNITAEILNKTEAIKSTSSHTADLRFSPELRAFSLTDTGSIGNRTGESEEREKTGHHGEMETERKRRKTAPEMQRHVEMSRCEASGHLFASGNITDATLPPTQRSIKEESTEEICTDHPPKSPMMMVECKHENTGATTSGQEAGESQVMKQETEVPQMSQASDIPQFSNMVEAPSSAPSTSCDLDTMGLDELKREKLKMQIKVLRLQEEYYTQKIQKHGSLVVKMMVARGQDHHSGITEGV